MLGFHLFWQHLLIRSNSQFYQNKKLNSAQLKLTRSVQTVLEREAKWLGVSALLNEKGQKKHGTSVTNLQKAEIFSLLNKVNTLLCFTLEIPEWYESRTSLYILIKSWKNTIIIQIIKLAYNKLSKHLIKAAASFLSTYGCLLQLQRNLRKRCIFLFFKCVSHPSWQKWDS